jgi:AI-2 transport protein TqsA
MEKIGIKLPLWIIAFAAIIWLLERTSTVLIPFVFAIFLYYIVYPVVEFVEAKLKISHFPAVMISLALFGLGWTLIGLMITSNIKSIFNSADTYQQQLNVFYSQTILWLQSWGIDLEQGESFKNVPFFAWLSQFSGGLVNMIGQAGLVGIFLLFLLAGKPTQQSSLLTEIQKQVTKYTVAKMLLSLIVGLLIGIIYAVLGVQMAALFGVIAFLTNFIPTFGALVATLLPLPIVLLQHGAGVVLILSVVLPVLVQFIMGNIVEAKIFGNSLDLHPVIILLSLIFWGLVWGIVGMLLAVPLMAVLKITFERFHSTKPFADLLAGRFVRQA